jgi:hypothetical protein
MIMDSETIKALIEKYRQQIETLQTVVAQLQTELSGSTGAPVPFSPAESKTQKARQQTGDVVSIVREWQFFNKSQPEAAEDLLQTIGHPLATGTIVECLEKGGMKVGGETAADKKQNLYTILARSGRFGRAARGTWGLPDWPNIKPVKMKRGGEKTEKATQQEQETKEAKEAKGHKAGA